MKNLFTTFSLISAVGTSLLCAQGTGTPRTPPTPATIAQHRVNALTTRLGLTSAQQAQALTYFTTSATSNASVETQLRTAHQSLKAAIEANNLANIGTLTNEIGTFTAQIALADSTAEAAFYMILTPAQQTTFNQEHGFGGGGGFGGGPAFRGRP